MLTLKNLSLRRGPRALFENVNLTLFPGYKVGITGANGCGKSSLLALIRRELQQDAGDFSLPSNLVIAHVAQETPATERIAIDYVMDGDEELRRIQNQLSEAEAANDGTRQATLHTRLEVIDAYTARARAARLLRGLGFAPGQEDQPVATFSGGWRMRLNLARALMCRSDLLLLDEPTNHLDLDAVIWLQEWLGHYPGTLLLISHDRDFLDDVADHIAHIEHNGIQLYSGNYSAFEIRRAEQLAGLQAARVRQQREIDHVQSFISRFRAQATKARQAQSRLKALARMAVIAPAHVDSPFDFEFRQPKKLPAPLLQLTDVSAGYAGKKIITEVTLSLSPGDRIGLLGPNGAGKSTLVKVLAGTLPIQDGVRLPAQDLRIGYFAARRVGSTATVERVVAKAARQEVIEVVRAIEARQNIGTAVAEHPGADGILDADQRVGFGHGNRAVERTVYRRAGCQVDSYGTDGPSVHGGVDSRAAIERLAAKSAVDQRVVARSADQSVVAGAV